jgi:uncharacterized protein YhaN
MTPRFVRTDAERKEAMERLAELENLAAMYRDEIEDFELFLCNGDNEDIEGDRRHAEECLSGVEQEIKQLRRRFPELYYGDTT